MDIKTEMVVRLGDVEIYRAVPTPFSIEINGKPFYQLSKQQVEEMIEENNGNSLWKALVGELGHQRSNRYLG